MGQVVERVQETRLVIWQGDLGEISQGYVHRVVQIAADDCIVERCRKGATHHPESWEAEDHDAYVANAYMLALLATRAQLDPRNS
jgi:hypothetical protein